MKGTKPAHDIERFTMRLPTDVVQAIDRARSQRPGVVSRRSWIEEAIVEKLAAEGSPVTSAASSRGNHA
jgi:metal-responsive CopG/Arc/MetJ family transcriptional regulator